MKRIILILILFLIGCVDCPAKDYYLKIHFVDIGEGDSILIQAKNEFALIDTGNLLSGHKLIDYLKENDVPAIKHLIITHHDLDHIMGVFFIMPKFKVENVYDNGFNLDTSHDAILAYYEKLFRLKENYHALKEGDVLKLGLVTLEIIWPPDLPLSGSFNHNSLVIMLRYKDFRCLLTADMDRAAETELLKKGLDLRSDILKVAHHGANDANTEDFIKKVNPKSAIISVDHNNVRGYPDRRVLDLLGGENITTYRTDKSGSIIVAINSKTDYVILPENHR